jgi:hypothetical protein
VRYATRLPLSGGEVPSTDTLASRGTVDLDDRRRFVGMSAHSRYEMTAAVSLLGGFEIG